MKGELLRERLPIVITATVAVLLYVVGGLFFPPFFTLRVLLNLLSDNAFLGIVAVGLTFVILTGGIDLSVGSMVGCTSIMTATLIESHHLHPLEAMALSLLFGLLVGTCQGLLIGRLKLPPFLITLGGLFFVRGLGLYISKESVEIKHPFFEKLVDFSVILPGKASVTAATLAFAIIVLAGVFVAKQTRFGRSAYAAGGSAASAELMGISVANTLVLAYALSGFCSALGGIVYTLYTSSGNASAATGLELDAIAAVVVGGTLLSGGYGSILGTLIGVCTLGIVQTAITFQGKLSSWWTRIFIGALLLAFMLVQKFLERAAARRA